MLGASLFMIFSGAVIASKFDSWYAIRGGATMAVVDCYLNQLSINWIMMLILGFLMILLFSWLHTPGSYY